MRNTLKKMNMFLLTVGVCAVAVVPSYTAQASEFTDAQKAELEELFKEFLANNPQDILDSVDNYRADQERKTQQSAQEKLTDYQEFFKQSDLPTAGNPDGDVTIVEYFDYNCGYCKKAFEDVQKILDSDKNVRVVFQEMPILSPSSGKMAQYALAAKNQDKYFEMHTALMNHRGPQSDDAFVGLAETLGLDTEQLKQDIDSKGVKDQITKSIQMARELGVRGTPGFIIGDRIYPGYIGLDAMKKAVAEARAQN